MKFIATAAFMLVAAVGATDDNAAEVRVCGKCVET